MKQLHYPQSEQGLILDDKQIGAVELKDAGSDMRALVHAGGALKVAQAPDATACQIMTKAVSVTTPGTPVALSNVALPVWRVDIVAKPGNSGRVCIGDASVNAASKRMAELKDNESYCIQCPNGARLDLSQVFVDATVAGEGVYYNAFTVAVAP